MYPYKSISGGVQTVFLSPHLNIVALQPDALCTAAWVIYQSLMPRAVHKTYQILRKILILNFFGENLWSLEQWLGTTAPYTIFGVSSQQNKS